MLAIAPTAQSPARSADKMIVKPVLVIYEVKTASRTLTVTVTPSGVMSCSCGGFKLNGDCQHLYAVQAEREARKTART